MRRWRRASAGASADARRWPRPLIPLIPTGPVADTPENRAKGFRRSRGRVEATSPEGQPEQELHKP